jgi:hypothetical protein
LYEGLQTANGPMRNINKNIKKHKDMKTTLNTAVSLARISTILAALSLLVLPVSLSAQSKGAAQLIPSRTVASAPATTARPMDCAQCKDASKTVSTIAKGGRVEKQTLTVHQCAACETRNTTAKMGKLAQDQVTHTCKMQKANAGSCCGTAPQANAAQ